MAPSSSKAGSRCSSSTQRSPILSGVQSQQQQRQQQQRMHQDVRRQLLQASSKTASGSKGGAGGCRGGGTAAAPTASSCPAGACDQPSKRVVQQQPQARENSHSNSNKRLVKDSKWQGAYVPSFGVLQPQAAHQRPAGSRNTGTPSATAAMHGAALAAAAATSTPAAPQSIRGTTPLTAAAATATAALAAAAATAAPETKAAPAATAAARTTTAAAVLAPPAASTPGAAASAAALLLAGSRPVTAVWRQDEPNGRRRVASAHAGDSGLRKGPPLGQRQQQQQRRPQQQTGGGMSLLSRVQAWFAGGDRDSPAASAQTKKEHAAGAAAGAAGPAAVFHSFSRSSLRRSNTTCSSIQTSAIAAAAAQRSHVAALLSSTAVPEEAPSAESGGSLRLSSLPSGFTYPPRVPVLEQPWAPTAGSSVLLAAGSSSSSPSATGGAAAAAASMSCAAGYPADSLCLQSPWGALASKMEPQQQQRAAFSGSVLLDMPPHQQLVSVTREDAALQQVPPLLHGRLQQQRQGQEEGQEGEEQQRKQREQAQLMQQFLQQQQERYATVRQASLSKDLSREQGYVTFAHAAAAAARYHMYGAAGETAAVRSRPSSVGAAARRAAPVAAAAAAAGYVSESLKARETAGTVKRTDPAPSGAVGEGTLATDARAEAAAAFSGAAESDVSAEEEKETEEKTAELPGGEDGKPLMCFSEDEKLAAAAAAVPAGVQASSSSETISSDNGSSSEAASRNTRQMSRSSGTRGTEKSSGHRSVDGKGNKSRGKGVESKAEVGAAGSAAPMECRERLERAEAEGKPAAMKMVSSGKKSAAAAACVAKKKHPSQKLKTARWRVQQEDTQDQHQQHKLQQPHQQMEQQKNQRKPHGSKVNVQQQRQQLLPSVTQECDDAGIVLQYQKPQEEHRHHCGLQQGVGEGKEGKEGEQEEAALTRQLVVLRPVGKKRQAVQQQQRQVEEQQERYGLPQEASEQQQQQGATGEEQQLETAANEEEAESGKCGVLKTREKQREKEVVTTAAAAGATEEEGEDRIRAAAEGAAAEKAATASGDAGRERAATPVTYETAAEGTRGGEEAVAEQVEGDTGVLEANAAIVSGAGGLAAEAAAANAADGARAGGAAATAEVTEDAAAQGDGATATAAALRPDDRNDTERIGAAENEEDAVMLPFGQAYPEGILKGCKKIYELDEELQHERERIVQVLLIHDTPDVYLLPHLLTAAQCRHIIDLCATRWRKSRTSKGLADAPPSEYSSTESHTRTSHSARLRPAETPVVAAVEEVAAAFAGCSVECLEPLAVVKYEEGESFKEHHDGAFRPVTLLIYLNDVEEGGETEFPYLHLKLTPTQGWGVMWRNAMPECETLGNSSESSSCSRRMCIDPRVLHAGLPPRKGGPKYVVNCFFNENPIRQAIAQAEAAAAQAAAAAAAAHEKEASEGAEARKAWGGRTPPEAAEDSRTATTGGAEPLPQAASPLLRNRTAAAASEEGRRLGQQPGYRTCNSFETTTTSTVASTPSDGRQPSAAFLLRQQQQFGGLQHGYGVVQQEQHQGLSSLSSQAQQQQQRLLQENWGSCQTLCSRIENPVRSAGSDHPGRYAVQHQQERKTTLVEIRGPKTAVAGSAVSAMASGSSVADIRNPLFAATAAARRGGAGVSGLQQHPQLARRGTQRHVAASPSRLVYGAAGSVRASSSGALFSTNGASLPSSSSSSRTLEDAQTAGLQPINNSGFSLCSMQAASRVQPPSSSGAAASKILHAELKTIPSASSNAYRQGFQGSVPTGSISSNIQRTRVGQTASCLQASGKIIQAFSNSSTYVQHGLTTGKSLAAPARLFHNGGARSEGMAGGYSTAAVGCYQQQVSREISAARGVRGSSLCRAGGVPAAGAAAHYGGRSGSSIFYPGATLAGASMTAAQSTAAGVGRGLDILGGHRPLNTQLCAGGGGQAAFNPFNLQGNNNFFSSAPAFMMVFGPDGVPQMKPLTQQQIEEGVGKHLLHEAIKNFKP